MSSGFPPELGTRLLAVDMLSDGAVFFSMSCGLGFWQLMWLQAFWQQALPLGEQGASAEVIGRLGVLLMNVASLLVFFNFFFPLAACVELSDIMRGSPQRGHTSRSDLA